MRKRARIPQLTPLSLGGHVCVGAHLALVVDAATKEVHMSFGELFQRYADISDTLVGILMRGKRRKRILFDSDMLFQGVHDHVVLRLMPA